MQLTIANEKENENTDKPEIPQNPSESEIAENNSSENNSGESAPENNSGIDKIIIDPEDNSESNSDNTETEVISNGESV